MFTLDLKLTEWENIPIYKLEDRFWDTGPENREYPGRAYVILVRKDNHIVLRDVEWDVPKDPDKEPRFYLELRRQCESFWIGKCLGWIYQEDLMPFINNLLTKKGVIEDGNT